MINFEQKAQAFALQWIKRYFDPERSKWKKARPWLLTLLLSARSGTFATSSPSLDGRRKESLKPFGPSSGLGRRILFGVVRSACQDRRMVSG